MSVPPSLDEQIVAALTKPCTAAEASAVHAIAAQALRDVAKKADDADLASLSPLASTAEARKFRETTNDLRFESDRLDASVSALRHRMAELESEERDRDRAERLAAATASRDELAARIKREYPRIVRGLTELVYQIAENDKVCRAVGIEGAEAIGRGYVRNHYDSGGFMVRLHDIVLPMPASNEQAWRSTGAGQELWPGLDLEAEA